MVYAAHSQHTQRRHEKEEENKGMERREKNMKKTYNGESRDIKTSHE
jgi:hypothetical protein